MDDLGKKRSYYYQPTSPSATKMYVIGLLRRSVTWLRPWLLSIIRIFMACSRWSHKHFFVPNRRVLSKPCPRDSWYRNHHLRRECHKCQAPLQPFSESDATETAAATTFVVPSGMHQGLGAKEARHVNF